MFSSDSQETTHGFPHFTRRESLEDAGYLRGGALIVSARVYTEGQEDWLLDFRLTHLEPESGGDVVANVSLKLVDQSLRRPGALSGELASNVEFSAAGRQPSLRTVFSAADVLNAGKLLNDTLMIECGLKVLSAGQQGVLSSLAKGLARGPTPTAYFWTIHNLDEQGMWLYSPTWNSSRWSWCVQHFHCSGRGVGGGG